MTPTDEKNAARWVFLRELVRTDTVRAQALIWFAGNSRTKFTEAVDKAMRESGDGKDTNG